MAKKISLTIAGAVSLGSYESGVVFEILDAIAQHNTWAEQQQPAAERFEIDVLTGASAGGMTVAMLAQRLLYDADSLTDPYNNPLYNAWVRRVDIAGDGNSPGLLPLRTKPITPPVNASEFLVPEPPANSLLSSDCVIAISVEAITSRYRTAPPPTPKPHPALTSDTDLYLGLALSNLSGVDYYRPTQSGNKFIYTEHQDQLLCTLHPPTADNIATWEPIRSAAVACGAFPFAFRTHDLSRTAKDYGANVSSEVFAAGDPRNFTYTDGGLFQNQPIGMAKNFVDHIPGARVDPEDRAYLFIAPHPKTSEELPWTDNASDDPKMAFGAANATFIAALNRLLSSVLGQSEFQDWVTAEQVNDKIRLLDRRAAELAGLFRKGTLKPEATAPIAAIFLQALFDTSTPGKNGLQTLAGARDQLRQQYAADYTRLQQAAPPDLGSQEIADAWIDSVLVLEYAAGLHYKEEMYIFDFVADPAKLAGGGIQAFQGFFDQSFRDHDYDYGRTQARTCLLAYQAKQGSFFSTLHWTPDPAKPIRPINTHLDDAPLTAISVDKRKLLASRLADGVDTLLGEAGLNSVVRWGLKTFIIKSKINKFLGL